MTNTELEEAIRDVLRGQAEAMNSEVDTPVRAQTNRAANSKPDPRWDAGGRGGWVLAAAACLIVAIGFVVLKADNDSVERGDQSTAASNPDQEPDGDAQENAFSGEAVYSLATKTIRMEASSIKVLLDQEYPYPPDAPADGDSGSDNYTTLELEWTNESSVGMRIYLYFSSDGSEWWVDEIRTYYDNGWASTETGEWFRSPLGEAHVGELRLRTLEIEDLVVQGFLPTDGCGDGVPGFALDPSEFSVTVRGPYGLDFRLRDRATCEELDVTQFASQLTIDIAVADPDVASFEREFHREEKYGTPGGMLGPVSAGETTLVATATDASGVEVARSEVQLIVPED